VTDAVRILGIAGSLRTASFNRAALRAAQQLVPAAARLETFELDGIPPFNEDHDRSLPPPVAALEAKIRETDAVLIVTPEYNYSIPGGAEERDRVRVPPLRRQRVGRQAGGDHGRVGGRARDGARAVPPAADVIFLDMYPVNTPEVMIGTAAQRFDEHGDLTDETSRKLIGQLLGALVAWTRRLRTSR
jgi:chromate reductase, NAD(P)H dehydrogenase (quinone)